MNKVSQNIEKIKSLFLDTQSFYAGIDSMEELVEYLEGIDASFRSIGYESVSMAIALKELEDFDAAGSIFPDINKKEWLFFADNLALKHKAQVYIGLGWAVAKLNIPFTKVVQKLDPRLHYRIADGCGYYDGSFRARLTLLSQQIPAYLPSPALPIYYQGVGRSLWYSCNADIDKVREKIKPFSPAIQGDLWRGLGIAIAYVGGCYETDLINIFEYAAEWSSNLADGASLAVRSRMEADSMTNDTDHCCRLWFMLNTVAENRAVDDENVYAGWIMQTERSLANGFQIRI